MSNPGLERSRGFKSFQELSKNIEERDSMAVRTVDFEVGFTEAQDYDNEGDNVMAESILSGEELAGNVPSATDYIKAVVEIFHQTSPTEYKLSELDSFEEVMVGVFLRKFHLMLEKQRGYGKNNISKAGLHGLFTRAQDKLERGKNIVGNPVEQVDKVQRMLERLDPDANAADMDMFIKKVDEIMNVQRYADESIEDTLMDLGNYGDIMYMVQMDAWGKDLEENIS